MWCGDLKEVGGRWLRWIFFFHVEIRLAVSCIGTSVCRWQSYSLLATYHSQSLPADGICQWCHLLSETSEDNLRLLRNFGWTQLSAFDWKGSALPFVNDSIFNLSWASVCMSQRRYYCLIGPLQSGLASLGLFYLSLQFYICFGSELSFRIKVFVTLGFRQPHK